VVVGCRCCRCWCCGCCCCCCCCCCAPRYPSLMRYAPHRRHLRAPRTRAACCAIPAAATLAALPQAAGGCVVGAALSLRLCSSTPLLECSCSTSIHHPLPSHY
jgi:hypothetical protein